MRLGSCGGCGARARAVPGDGVVRDGRAARLVRRGGTGRRITVPGGQPQLDRSTSSVGSNCTLGRRPGRAIRSSRRVQACSPSSRIGWWTVVSGGSYRLPGKMSSKPTTATCSGTRTPAFAKACSTPMAIWSFAQTTASGSESPLAASSFSPASSPLSDAEHALVPAEELAGRMGTEQFVQRKAPFPGVRGARRPVDVVQPPPAVVVDQVGHQGGRAGPVVGRHHVRRPLAGIPGDDHHGQPFGQPRQERRRHHALADQQAVDLDRTVKAAGAGRGRWPPGDR